MASIQPHLRPGVDTVFSPWVWGSHWVFFQVLGFATFFALVLKSLEDEEEFMVPHLGHLSSPGNGAQVEAGAGNLIKLRKP